MFKKSIVLVLMLSNLISFSQEATNSFPLELKGNRDVFQIVNEANKNVSLFVSDRKEVSSFLLNESMQITDSIKTERPERKYTDIAGYINKDKNIRLYWSSEDHKEIYTQLYDTENHTVLNQEYALSLKNEKFVQNFSENNLFYMVTIVKESNLLKFYIFDIDGKMSEKTIDFNGFRFLDKDNHKSNFYSILREFKKALNASISLQKITPENTTSLTYSSNKRKCYLKNNKLTITIDLSIDFTQLIIIDLNTFTATEKFIKNPYIYYENSLEVDSNSFLMDDKLYQIKSSSSMLKLSIKTLDDTLLKEYTATETEPIDFKNSDIIQKGTVKSGLFPIDNDRVLEKTKQFLRKLHNASCAISCYNLNGNTLLTLGSVTDLNVGGVMMPMGAPGFGGANFGSTSFPNFQFMYVNPTYDNFNSYKNRKVVFINCLFDKDNNHVSGELKPIAFDKIQGFLVEDDKQDTLSFFSNPENKEKSKTVFKLDSNYYLGHYDNKTKRYVIRKFTD
jgi:hypothetical protein